MRRVDRAALVLGLGIGGFVDGIVIHQLLGWHHMLSGWYPVDDVHLMMIGDGLFHLFCLLLVLVGTAMLNRRPPLPNAVLAGGILAGWGVFNLVEGVIDHQVLGVHHVRHGPDQLVYDIAFLISGAVLVAVGVLTSRTSSAQGVTAAPPGTPDGSRSPERNTLMRSRVRAAGHAVHPILIVFPLGLLTTAVGFDVLHLVTDRPSFAFTAAHLIAAGVLMGVLTAATGWLDWWLVVPKGTRAHRIGLVHGLVNTAVLVVFAISWMLRLAETDWTPTWPAVIAGWLGVLAAGLGGWLGGELVERLGISVEEGAHPDASSSLSGAAPSRR